MDSKCVDALKVIGMMGFSFVLWKYDTIRLKKITDSNQIVREKSIFEKILSKVPLPEK